MAAWEGPATNRPTSAHARSAASANPSLALPRGLLARTARVPDRMTRNPRELRPSHEARQTPPNNPPTLLMSHPFHGAPPRRCHPDTTRQSDCYHAVVHLSSRAEQSGAAAPQVGTFPAPTDRAL